VLVLHVGVGKDGDDEQPSSEVRGSHAGCADHSPLAHIPESVKVSDDAREPPCSERGDVLDDDRERADLLDDAAELSPKSASCAVEARALASGANVLARETATDDVDKGKIESCSDIVVPLSVGPMASQHTPAERVSLDLPNGLGVKSTLNAEFKAADAGKERADLHLRRRFLTRSMLLMVASACRHARSARAMSPRT